MTTTKETADQDIVDRLLNYEREIWQDRLDAADEIERLRTGNRLHLELALTKEAEIERLREALLMWDYLIEYQYSGSREAMSDMTHAARHTAQLLYGDPPWPSPRPALKEKE